MSVAELYLGEYLKGFWTVKGRKTVRQFFADHGKNVRGAGVYCRDDQGRIVEARDVKDCEDALSKKRDLFCVKTDPWIIRCSWKGTTQDGKVVYVEFDAAVQPNLDETFWLCWEQEILATREIGGRVEETTVAARVSEKAKLIVQQAISQKTFAELDGIAGADYWRTYVFEETLGDLGLTYSEACVAPARFTAPSVEKENDLNRRKEEQKESLRRKEEVLEYLKETTQIDEQIRQLEFEPELSELEREFQRMELHAKMDEVRKKHEIKMLELEKEYEVKARDFEAERRRPDEERAERERSEARVAKIDNLIKNAVDSIRTLHDETTRVIQDWKDGYLKTLSAPAFNAYLNGVSQDAVEAMGLARKRRFYSRRFHDVERKFSVAINAIERKRDPRSNLDTAFVWCNQEINVEFRPPIDGYVTVLNLGASGCFWRVVPNCDGVTGDWRDKYRISGVGPREAFVLQGKDYSIPGDNLYRGRLFEGRPKRWDGDSLHNCWEEFIVVVTKNKPLFDDYDRVNRSYPDEPFVEISQERLERVIDQLGELKADEFAVGTCEFTLLER